MRNRLHITKIIDHLAALPLERPKVTLSVEGNIGTGKVRARPRRLGAHARARAQVKDPRRPAAYVQGGRVRMEGQGKHVLTERRLQGACSPGTWQTGSWCACLCRQRSSASSTATTSRPATST